MPRTKTPSTPSARRAWLLAAAFLLLLLISLGLRYGDRLRGLGELLPGRADEDRRAAPALLEMTGEGASTASEPAAAPPPRLLRLQILNATGLNDLALRTGERLRAWDIDAIDRGNAPAWPFPETLLILRSQRREAVADFARRLGGVPLVVQRREDLMLDATLVLGHDWERYRWPEP